MEEIFRVRQDVLTHFARIIEMVAPELPDALGRKARTAWERLDSGQYRVVVCGGFRSGKSTLLNTLVDRPGLFPVSPDVVTTSTVVSLSWADEEQVVAHFDRRPGDPGPLWQPLELIPLDRLAEFGTEPTGPVHRRDVRQVEVGLPLPRLESGLVLVDTPGIGTTHTEVVRAELAEADVLVFVASAVEPPGTEELSFLADSVAFCPEVITVVTFLDLVADPEPVIRELTGRIAGTIGIPPEELVVVPGLSDQLADFCCRVQVLAALDTWEELVDALRRPEAERLTALVDDAPTGLRNELADLRAEVESRKKQQSRQLASLPLDLERAARPVRRRLAEDFDKLTVDFRTDSYGEQGQRDPDGVAGWVAAKTADIVAGAERELLVAASTVARQYGLDAYTEGGFTEPAAGTDPEIEQRPVEHPPEAGRPARVRAGRGGVTAYGSTGAFLGVIAGTIVLPGVGTMVGAAVGGLAGQVSGWFAGRREGERRHELRRRREVGAQLRELGLSKIESARRAAERDLDNQQRDLSASLGETLEASHRTELGILADRAADLNDALLESERRRDAALVDLETMLEHYTRLLEECDALRDRLEAVGPPKIGRTG
ncbi:dynamin family protein [Micromonospora sp. NBC_01796]|uniref:dynamin family protein n=1 Tax=Micromonospora sp. NBC_01796 TaxID=2975987 RepID=UPI002DDA4938|nr:dynamin family protein [Micromonospora sp. NBC_01796]WSA87296.1 dynamin family protein [Micromonospora sp. NBC_01796]